MSTLPYLLALVLTTAILGQSAPSKIIVARDGKRMVLIPGGTFRMGSDHGYSEEAPVHPVRVDSFYMDEKLVTNREFKTFCDSARLPYPENPRWGDMPNYFLDFPDYPVVNVSLDEASRYAAWAGKRIPTEEEWEYAACGGLETPMYPWGDSAPDATKAKFADRSVDYPWRDFRISSPWKYTAPVGSFSPNGYGLYDMAGNVYQWTTDWFFRYDDAVRDTVPFQDGWGGSKVVRGGCYYSDAFDLRVARRRLQPLGSAFFSVGFRCVKAIHSDTSTRAWVNPTDETKQKDRSTDWRHRLDKTQISTPPGLRLCLGEYNSLTPEQAQRFKNAGFSSVEFYLTWESVENKGEDRWDFSSWDKQVQILKNAGLKWTPFIIAGPAYSLPEWYRTGKHFVGLRCLEHNIESRINSIWDPEFYTYVDRFLARVAKQYGNSGTLEGVLLGICGDFGEAIYPVWHGGWPPTIAGLYHTHPGYWCNDPFARAAFVRDMRERFKNDLSALNAYWCTTFTSFASVTMPSVQVDRVEGFRVDELSPKGEFPIRTLQDRRRWVDFIDWYRWSMTHYADVWMRLGRKHFPNIPVYLCTGGDASSGQGSNFADQCRVAAKYHGGIRITNESTDFGLNFTLTNWVATASHLYGNQFGFEPAGGVRDLGVVSRIYNAATAGVNEFMTYAGNIDDQEVKMDLFLKYVSRITPNTPSKEGALFYPDLDLMVGRVDFMKDFVPVASLVRDYADIMFADDRLIAGGILKQAKWLMLFNARWLRKESIETIKAWTENGGLLIAANTDSLCSIEDGENAFPDLFDVRGGQRVVGRGSTLYVPGKFGVVKEILPVRDLAPGVGPADGTCEQYQAFLFDPVTVFLQAHGIIISDGRIDRLFTAVRGGSLRLLNHTRNRIDRTMTMPTGESVRVAIEGNSIEDIKK